MNTTTGPRSPARGSRHAAEQPEPAPLLDLLDVRGDVIFRAEAAVLAAVVAGPNRDRYWIREADGQTLAARAWERTHALAA